jgi:hypothetical protein
LIDVFLFSIVGYLAYQQLRKSRIDLRGGDGGQLGSGSGATAPVSSAGGETRSVFMGMLALSNFSRAITLCIEGFTQQDKQIQRSVRTWVRDFLSSLPTLFFLTTYSVVILFWAQVYYASVLVSFPLLKPIVIFINIAVYVVFSVIACLTLLLMAWSEFRQYLYFLLGVIFLFCGLNFFYYGVKVAAQLSDRNKQLSRKSRIIKRVVILTSSVPLILLARGVYCSMVGLGFIAGYPPWGLSKLTWDSLNFFVTEFVPSVLMLMVFWPGSPRPESDDVYEAPNSSLISSNSDLVAAANRRLSSLESPLLQNAAPAGDTPMSEPPVIRSAHPHLREAQNRLEKLVEQSRGGRRVPSMESQGNPLPEGSPEIGPIAEELVNRPWTNRGGQHNVV